jgi:predicted acyltransferase (DUF342 family)
MKRFLATVCATLWVLPSALYAQGLGASQLILTNSSGGGVILQPDPMAPPPLQPLLITPPPAAGHQLVYTPAWTLNRLVKWTNAAAPVLGNSLISDDGTTVEIGNGNLSITNTDGTARELRLYEPSGSGTNYTAFVAQAQASNITYTLPADLTAGTLVTNARILQSDDNGNLSWLSPTALAAATAWTLTGNSGTDPAVNFLGTTDAQPLVIRVGNQETFRFNPPGSSAPAWSIQRSGVGGGGGNQRGLHAVDLQSFRSAATQVASGDYSVIGGGLDNTASDFAATVGGGYGNTASGYIATVGGGRSNTASGLAATIGGGNQNTASGIAATVGGGFGHTASGFSATVGGGNENTASGDRATVGGGGNNIASGDRATVGGGFGNTASGNYATVGGGWNNIASGDFSAIPGGSYLQVGTRSFGFSGQTSLTLTDLSANSNIAAFVDVDLWLYSRDRTQASQLRFYEAQAHGSGANYVALRAPTSLSVNTIYTLPADLTTTNIVATGILQTDGSGNLSWVTPAAVVAAGGAWLVGGNTFVGAPAVRVLGITSTNGDALALYTDNAERVRITATGNVGIGTASPTALLHVAGTGRFDGQLTVTTGGAAITGNSTVTGTLGVSSDVSVGGNLTVDGNTTLGNNAAVDLVTFNARVQSNVEPSANNAYDLGSSSLRWANVYGVNGDFSTVTVSGLTPGSVIFAGTGGALSQNNAKFFWDNGNERLGIGTNTPAATLHVVGTGRFDGQLTVTTGGAAITGNSTVTGTLGVSSDVSVGGNLTVDGNTTLGNNAAVDLVTFNARVQSNVEPSANNAYDLGSSSLRWANVYGVNGDFSTVTVSGLTPGSVIFAGTGGALSQNNAKFFWDNGNERLGIGTNTPAATLHVVGTGRFDGQLTVTTGGAAITGNSTVTGTLGVSSDVSVGGNLTVDGNTTLGNNAAVDLVTFNARVQSNVEPSANNAYDLGSSSLRWANIYGDNGSLSGGLTVAGTLNVGGGSLLQGNTVIGGAATDEVQFVGRVVTDVLPKTNNAYDLASLRSNVYGVFQHGDTGGALSQNNAKFFWDNGNERLGIGTNTPAATLHVVGTGRFDGQLTVTTGGAAITGNSTVTGTLGVSSDVSVGGNLTVDGNTTLGNNAAVDLVTFNARVQSNVEPSANNAYDLGSSSLRWANVYGVNGDFSTVTVSGLTPGSVIFAGTGGALSQNNAKFFWDNGNERLGIGTNTPAATLHVVGTGRFDGQLTVTTGGAAITGNSTVTGTLGVSSDVSVGGNLTVDGNTTLGNNAAVDLVTFNARVQSNVEPSANNAYDLGSSSLRWANVYGVNGDFSTVTVSGLTPGSVIFAGTGGALSQNNAKFFWDNGNERLGIGTNTPAATLHVVGTGRFDGQLTVTTGGAAITGNSTVTGTLGVSSDVSVGGNLTVDGNTTLGNNAAVDLVTFNARVQSNVEPSANNAYDLGSSSLRWANIYGDNGSLSGGLTVAGTLNVGGGSLLQGNTVIGGAATDEVQFVGRVVTDVLPKTNNAYDLGSSSLRWANVYGVNGDFSTVTVSGLTPGSVIFAGTGGALSQNNAKFFWDNGNERLGIGTNTPAATLHVVGTGRFDGQLTVTTGGAAITGNSTVTGTLGVSSDVSVGGNLTVDGNTTLGNNAAVDLVTFNARVQSNVEPSANNAYDLGSSSLRWANVYGVNGDFSTVTVSGLTPGSVIFAGTGGALSQNNAKFFWDNGNERLGIGTNTPAATLHVVGTGRFDGQLTVTTGGAAITGNSTVTGTLGVSSDVSVGGNLTVDGNTTLGNNAAVDLVTFNARVQSNVEPSANNAYDLGSSSLRWANVYGVNGDFSTVTVSGLTPGSVIFAGTGGALSQNNAKFFWDNGNERLGIGTNTPAATLHVVGTGRFDGQLTVTTGGAAITGNSTVTGTLGVSSDVSVGGNLTVDGNTTLGNNAAVDLVTFNARVQSNVEPSANNAYDLGSSSLRWANVYGVNGDFSTVTVSGLTPGSVIFAGTGGALSQNNAKFFWDNGNERLGIGTNTPAATLHVVGTGRFDGQLTVTTGGAAITGNSTVTGTLGVSSDVSVGGNLTVDGNTTLGNNAAVDLVTFNARVQSNVEPSANNAYDLGSSSLRWANIYGDNGSLSGGLTVAGTLNVGGGSLLQGNTVIGGAATDEVQFVGRVVTDVLPKTNNAYDLGSSSLRWANVYGVNGDFSTVTVSGLTPGSVIFAGTGGALSQNNAKFFWDNGNERLGIGTNTPAATLHVVGTGRFDGQLTVTTGGAAITGNSTVTGTLGVSSDVSVGGNLTVDGNTTLGNNAAVDLVTFNARVQSNVEPSANNAYDLGSSSLRWANVYGVNGDFSTVTVSGLTPGSVIFAGTGGALSQNNAKFFWDNGNERLGIGTNTPAATLHVVGTGRFDGQLTVTTGGAAITGNSTVTGTLGVSSDVSVGGNLTVDGNTTLGNNAAVDLVTFNARVQSNVEPSANNAYDLGSSSLRWANIYGDNGSLSGGLTVAGTLNVGGGSLLQGNTVIGGAATDEVQFVGRVVTDVLPKTNNAYDLGSSSLRWANVYGVNGDFSTVTVSGLTPGSVIFAGTGGALSQNNAKFFWDNGNERLGIGTNTPAATLHVVGTGRFDGQLTVTTGGAAITGNSTVTGTLGVSSDVSVGGNLTVDGNTTLGNNAAVDLVTFNARVQSNVEPSANNAYDLGSSSLRWANVYGVNGDFSTVTVSGLTPGSVIFAGTGGALSQNNAKFFWDNGNERLGIGTNTPAATLHVVGTGRFDGQLTVTTGGAAITGNSTVTGTLGVSSDVSVGGNLTVDGNTTLGNNAAVDLVTFNARVQSHVVPSANNTYDLGEDATPLRWRSGYFGTQVKVGTSVSLVAATNALEYTGGDGRISVAGASALRVSTNGVERLIVDGSGHVLPGADNAYDLGSATQRWANLYAYNGKVDNDLTVSNTLNVGNGIVVSTGGITVGGGGATILGNSSITGDLTVTGNVLPGADNTYDLGSPTDRWANLYAYNGKVDNDLTVSNTLNVGNGIVVSIGGITVGGGGATIQGDLSTSGGTVAFSETATITGVDPTIPNGVVVVEIDGGSGTVTLPSGTQGQLLFIRRYNSSASLTLPGVEPNGSDFSSSANFHAILMYIGGAWRLMSVR